MQDFKVIIITSPDFIENESEKLVKLFKAGVDFIHIRKPDLTLRDVKNLIEDIPYEFRKRIRLHGHFELFNEFNLAGAHLNRRNPKAPLIVSSLTASIHSLDEIEKISKSINYDYLFLSPVYNSISKKGYMSKFDLGNIKNAIKDKKIIGLGGVKPSNLKELKDTGFIGGTLMGYVWENQFDKVISELENSLLEIKK